MMGIEHIDEGDMHNNDPDADSDTDVEELAIPNQGQIRTGRPSLSSMSLRVRAENRSPEHGRAKAYKSLTRRVHSQEKELANIATKVHHGGKEDFCMALAMSIKKRSQENTEHVQWDGKLHVSSEDIIYVLKNIQVKSNSSMISLYT